MASKIKTIGVLTSGGDAPGMNAAIRAVVRMAINKGIKVKGIYQGYKGLLNEEIVDLDARAVSDTISKGGTFLYTARSMEFRTPEGQKQAAENCRKNGIEGLVVIGGDGSFAGAGKLAELGITTIGEPKLGKYGLVPTMSSKETYQETLIIKDVCAYADGNNDLIRLSELIEKPVREIIPVLDKLKNAGLLVKV